MQCECCLRYPCSAPSLIARDSCRVEVAEELPTLRSQLTLLEQKAKDLSEQVAKISHSSSNYFGQRSDQDSIWGAHFPSFSPNGANHVSPEPNRAFAKGIQGQHVAFQEPRFAELPPGGQTNERTYTVGQVGGLELVDLLADPWKLEESSFEYSSYSSTTDDGAPLPDMQYQDFLASLDQMPL